MKRVFHMTSVRKPLLAASVAAIAMMAMPAFAQSEAADDSVSEGDIIVTAQKRSERLQDTPVPVTALDANALAARNLTRLQDYFTQVPGLSLNAQGNGKTNIVLRGITTANFGNPTVAVSIDDVPYGSSTAVADGQLVQPDLDPSDLQRIEVLRGPQGTLYGASSLGGLIKYVTADPSTERVSGRLQADISTVHKGELGYAVRGSLNLPVSDKVAIRASGYTRRSPGYIDNVLTGAKDVNTIDVIGGRVALLLKPTDTLTIKLAAMHQDTKGDGTSRTSTNYFLEPTAGELTQSYLPDSGRFHTKSTLLTANIELDLDAINIKSVTGYGRNTNRERSDFSRSFPPVSYLSNNMRTNKFTQEVRFSSPSGQPLEWLVGGFYTKENSSSVQLIDEAAPVTGKYISNLLTADFPTTFEELAAFADVTYHFTPKFNIQVGGRYSGNRQTIFEVDSGSLIGPDPVVAADGISNDESVTFLVVPQYKFSRNLMTYLRFASGYRPGGPNGAVFGVPNLPTSFKADTTMNYEAGIKGSAFDGHFTFDISAYYIDWDKVHLQLIVNGLSIFTNGGKAKSRGVEGAFQFRTGGLTIAANGSYGVAELAEDPPAAIIADKGDRLPFSPKFSGSLSVDQDVHLNSEWTASFGGTVSHVGQRYGAIKPRPTSVRLNLPAYTTLDLRVGVRNDDWAISVFGRNMTDKRGVLSSMAEGASSLAGVYGTNFIQPRTFGVSVARNF